MSDFLVGAMLVALVWFVIRSAVISAIHAAVPQPGDWYELDDNGKAHRRRSGEHAQFSPD